MPIRSAMLSLRASFFATAVALASGPLATDTGAQAVGDSQPKATGKRPQLPRLRLGAEAPPASGAQPAGLEATEPLQVGGPGRNTFGLMDGGLVDSEVRRRPATGAIPGWGGPPLAIPPLSPHATPLAPLMLADAEKEPATFNLVELAATNGTSGDPVPRPASERAWAPTLLSFDDIVSGTDGLATPTSILEGEQ